MARAQGARSQLLAAFETDYGVSPGSGFTRLPFATSSLGSEQPLLANELLGYGRDPLAPVLDAITVDGDIAVPIDAEAFGFWLRAAFGDAETHIEYARAFIVFNGNPEPGDTITLNGKTWTFVEDNPGSNETEIKVDAAATVAQLKTDLSGSVDVDVAAADYFVKDGTTLVVSHAAGGPAGNEFTVAAWSQDVDIQVSDTTLRGGGYTHMFKTGNWDLPSLSLEVGIPEVPRYAMYSGVMVDQISLTMQRSGLLTATVQVVAQGEKVAPASQADTPAELNLTRFGHFNGSVRRNAVPMGNVVSAQVTYANNLDRIETIRSDGKIDGADPSVAALTGTLEMRFADQTLYDQAVAGEPCFIALEHTIFSPGGTEDFRFWAWAGKAYLSRPRLQIEGPQGIQVTFDWQAARDPSTGRMGTFGLRNHIASYTP